MGLVGPKHLRKIIDPTIESEELCRPKSNIKSIKLSTELNLNASTTIICINKPKSSIKFENYYGNIYKYPTVQSEYEVGCHKNVGEFSFQFKALASANSITSSTGSAAAHASTSSTTVSPSSIISTSFLQRFKRTIWFPYTLSTSPSEIISLKKSGNSLYRVLQQFSADLLISSQTIQGTAKNNIYFSKIKKSSKDISSNTLDEAITGSDLKYRNKVKKKKIMDDKNTDLVTAIDLINHSTLESNEDPNKNKSSSAPIKIKKEKVDNVTYTTLDVIPSPEVQNKNLTVRFIRKSVEQSGEPLSIDFLELDADFLRDYDANIEILSLEAEHLESQFHTPTRIRIASLARQHLYSSVFNIESSVLIGNVISLATGTTNIPSNDTSDTTDIKKSRADVGNTKRVVFEVDERVSKDITNLSRLVEINPLSLNLLPPSDGEIESLFDVDTEEERLEAFLPSFFSSITFSLSDSISEINKHSFTFKPGEPIAMSPCGRFFKFAHEMGRGSFKTVYRGLDTDSGIAIAWCELLNKQVKKRERKRFRKEADMLKQLQHPNIVRFYTYWEYIVSRKRNIVLITELMLSGTLKSYIKRFKKINPKVLKSWCRQILKGLHFLHTRPFPIIHRDLKCDNIFITGTTGSVKIGDLGLATLKSRSQVKSVTGTPEFMAPEMYEEQYDESVDVYAFGMCMLEMATCEYPYSECTGPAQIYKRVISGIKPVSLCRVEDPKVRDIIFKCIEVKKVDRPSCENLLSLEFFEDDTNIRLEPTTAADFLTNFDNNIINFRLKFLDSKKRSSIYKENEAIQFKFDVNKDNCEKLCNDMKQDNILSEEDAAAVLRLLKIQMYSLLKERVQRQMQIHLKHERFRLVKLALKRKLQMLPSCAEVDDDDDDEDNGDDEEDNCVDGDDSEDRDDNTDRFYGNDHKTCNDHDDCDDDNHADGKDGDYKDSKDDNHAVHDEHISHYHADQNDHGDHNDYVNHEDHNNHNNYNDENNDTADKDRYHHDHCDSNIRTDYDDANVHVDNNDYGECDNDQIERYDHDDDDGDDDDDNDPYFHDVLTDNESDSKRNYNDDHDNNRVAHHGSADYAINNDVDQEGELDSGNDDNTKEAIQAQHQLSAILQIEPTMTLLQHQSSDYNQKVTTISMCNSTPDVHLYH